jgi:hypothetical protein
VLLLFPLWGILHPQARTVMGLLPFTALGWLCTGVIVAGVLRARRPVAFETLRRSSRRPYPAALTGCPWAWNHRPFGKKSFEINSERAVALRSRTLRGWLGRLALEGEA